MERPCPVEKAVLSQTLPGLYHTDSLGLVDLLLPVTQAGAGPREIITDSRETDL